MIRIKLFALFITFALLALVRPRKCLELLEAADAGAKAQAEKDLIERQNVLVQRAPEEDIGCLREQASAWQAVTEVLNRVAPGWSESSTPAKGVDLAVSAIKHRRAPVRLSESEIEKFKERKDWSAADWAKHVGAWENGAQQVCFGSWMAVRAMLIQFQDHAVRSACGVVSRDECPLPPTGWRCTRRAGHDGPCATVVK